MRAQLAQLCQDTELEFWPCNVTFRDHTKINWDRVVGYSQIMDVYLLALTVRNDGALATWEHRVALSAVRGAQGKHLQLL